MIWISLFLVVSTFNLAWGQGRLQIQPQQQLTTTTTPVPILRQVNQQNEDGSFTYGYENADGTYKIESRDASGQVKGKYGYYDNEGTLREIEYGANKHGFNPSGTGINIPPQVIPKSNEHEIEDDDGSYRAPGPGQDGAYDRFKYENQQGDSSQQQQQQQQPQFVQFQQQRQRKQKPRNQARLLQQPQYYQPQQQYIQQEQPQQQQFQYVQPQPQYQQQQQQQTQQQQQYAYQPINLPSNTFQGHPASNIDVNSGSYTLNYG